MANMSGKSRFPIDAALILRNTSDGAVTADTDLAVQKLVSKGAYWQNPADVRDGEVTLVVQTGAFGGTGVSTQIDIYTCEDASKGNPKLYGSFPVDASSWAEIDLDQISMLKQHEAASHWYATINVAGTTPSVPVFAYLAPPSSI